VFCYIIKKAPSSIHIHNHNRTDFLKPWRCYWLLNHLRENHDIEHVLILIFFETDFNRLPNRHSGEKTSSPTVGSIIIINAVVVVVNDDYVVYCCLFLLLFHHRDLSVSILFVLCSVDATTLNIKFFNR
jgi:hypothetical protein